MLSFVLLVLLLLSATFLYKKRFTSETKIGGLYIVQIYYLFMTPIAALLLFDIGSGIFSRPTVGDYPIPSQVLFNIFNFSVMTAVVGMGIHSTSTSVFQSFNGNSESSEAYKTNELFHGPWSHNMIYLGVIFSIILMGLLEINHPYFGPTFNFNLLLGAGILLGIMGAVGMLRALPLRYDLPIVFSLLGSILLGYSVRTYATNINSYPMVIISLSCLVTLFILLLMASLVFMISENLSHKMVKRAFPKGHPFHEGIDMKVLFKKIEHDFLPDKKP